MNEPVAVIDASLVLKVILPNPDMELCQAVLEKLQPVVLAAPTLWVYEVTSTLAKAVHFKQLTSEEGYAALHHSLELDVQLIAPDEVQTAQALGWSLRLKRASAYDSFYLAIAETLEAQFWTADQRLVNSFQGQRPGWVHYIGEIIDQQ